MPIVQASNLTMFRTHDYQITTVISTAIIADRKPIMTVVEFDGLTTNMPWLILFLQNWYSTTLTLYVYNADFEEEFLPIILVQLLRRLEGTTRQSVPDPGQSVPDPDLSIPDPDLSVPDPNLSVPDPFKPAAKLHFIAEAPISKFVEKAALRFHVKGTRYIFELARFDAYSPLKTKLIAMDSESTIPHVHWQRKTNCVLGGFGVRLRVDDYQLRNSYEANIVLDDHDLLCIYAENK
ncbi:uncharacterized protein PFLUO_LOCUS6751 [Penicillium psychrofluorescens]|uniref:uncharacterized protein n=1 Tax=Penicillium psychrofluorescens TaxID=3158075 RepID=UPI003CCD7BF6